MNALTSAQNCLSTYAAAIDDGNFSIIEQLFKAGRLEDASGACLAEGGAKVRQFYESLIRIYPETGTPNTQHHVSNIAIIDATDKQI